MRALFRVLLLCCFFVQLMGAAELGVRQVCAAQVPIPVCCTPPCASEPPRANGLTAVSR